MPGGSVFPSFGWIKYGLEVLAPLMFSADVSITRVSSNYEDVSSFSEC
jgi:hypothetical protein